MCIRHACIIYAMIYNAVMYTMFTRSNKHSLSKALPWFAPCTLEPWSWLISDSEHISYTREDPKPPGHHSRSIANSHARMEPRRSTRPVTNKAAANGSCCVHVVSMLCPCSPTLHLSPTGPLPLGAEKTLPGGVTIKVRPRMAWGSFLGTLEPS